MTFSPPGTDRVDKLLHECLNDPSAAWQEACSWAVFGAKTRGEDWKLECKEDEDAGWGVTEVKPAISFFLFSYLQSFNQQMQHLDPTAVVQEVELLYLSCDCMIKKFGNKYFYFLVRYLVCFLEIFVHTWGSRVNGATWNGDCGYLSSSESELVVDIRVALVHVACCFSLIHLVLPFFCRPFHWEWQWLDQS